MRARFLALVFAACGTGGVCTGCGGGGDDLPGGLPAAFTLEATRTDTNTAPDCPNGTTWVVQFDGVDTDAPLYVVVDGGGEDAVSCTAPTADGDGARMTCQSVAGNPVIYDVTSTFYFDGNGGGTIENRGVQRANPGNFPCATSYVIDAIIEA